VVGVDVARVDIVAAPDDRVRAAEEALRDAERDLAAVEGADAADAARNDLLRRLATRSGDRLAAALADGSAGPDRIAEIGTAVAAQLVELAASRQAHAERRTEAERARAAAQAELHRLRASGRARREIRIAVESDAAGDLDLEATYLVTGAGWTSAYDGRLEGEKLALTWYGMVSQATGEDWPAVELTLSTARAALAGTVPELDPWWVDVRPPIVPLSAPAAAPKLARAEAVVDVVAEAVPGTLAVAWRLPRPTAVPADGTPHRATVATATLEARLDHVTAPVLDANAHLRAVVANTTGTALPPGPLSAFLDGAFVGTSQIEQTAPGEELELALGIDDRVSVERELVDRTTSRAIIGGKVGTMERWRITVHNGRPAAAHVVVRDRVPVSRHADLQVADVGYTPNPTERDELGRVEWVVDVAPGATWEAQLRFGLRHSRDVLVVGWR